DRFDGREIAAIGLVCRDGERNDDSIARWGKELGHRAGGRKVVAFGHVEGKPVVENAARMNQGNGAVVKRLGVEFDTGESIRGIPKRRGRKVNGVFEVPALHLKVV